MRKPVSSIFPHLQDIFCACSCVCTCVFRIFGHCQKQDVSYPQHVYLRYSPLLSSPAEVVVKSMLNFTFTITYYN